MFFLLYAITWFLRECRPWWEGIFVDWHHGSEATRLHRSLRNPHRSQRARPFLYPIWHRSRSASPLILFFLARPALYSCRWTTLFRNPCTLHPPPRKPPRRRRWRKRSKSTATPHRNLVAPRLGAGTRVADRHRRPLPSHRFHKESTQRRRTQRLNR